MSASTRCIANTRVVIDDDVRNTRREYFSPQTPKEVLHNNVEVSRAYQWIELVAYRDWCESTGDDLPESPPALRVSIRHNDTNTVYVRWFAEGDLDQARHELLCIEGKGGVA
ncbi:MAG: hypothetical protein RBS80_22960 [Thermoguttaceae bacterium]|jgi:hypothetical protein|nr:hypothetical protein [Thermoguttaceae bacterium]